MTSAAARLSPQTCFRLPHCLGRFAPCGYAHPPGDAGYGDFVTSAKAALPWLANYRLPPVIVLPVLMLMQMVLMAMVVILCACSSRCVGILLYVILVLVLLAVFYYIGIRHTAIIVLYRILRLLIIPALRRNFPSVVCEGQCKASVVHSHYGQQCLCCGNESRKEVSCGYCTVKPAQKPCWCSMAPLRLQSSRRRAQ